MKYSRRIKLQQKMKKKERSTCLETWKCVVIGWKRKECKHEYKENENKTIYESLLAKEVI